MRKLLHQFYSSGFWPYILFAGLIGLAYGIYISRWGLYYDDWPEFYVFYNRLSLFEYYQFDRPLIAPIVFLLSKLGGTDVVAWQIMAVLLRWMLIGSFYWFWITLWPKAKSIGVVAAAIFSLHPAYSLQPIAVTFSKAYLLYSLYFFSLGLMIKALLNIPKSRLFTFFALLTMGLHLLPLEYFWGLELVRPLVVWMTLSRVEQTTKIRIIQTFKKSLPYLGLLILAIVWRLFLAQYPSDNFYFVNGHHNPLLFLQNLLSNSQTMTEYIGTILRDIGYLLLFSWTKTPITEISLITQIKFLVISLAGAILVVFTYFYFFRQERETSAIHKVILHTEHQILLLGICAIVFGMIPAWSIGNNPSRLALFNDRHALAALSGVSLIIAGTFSTLRSNYYKGLLLVPLVMMAFFYQLQNGYDYYQNWKHERNFSWQLYWRAPALKPKSFVITDKVSFLKYLTTSEVHLGPLIALVYSNTSGEYPSQWAFSMDTLLHHHTPAEISSGTTLSWAVRTLEFSASSLNALPVFYDPAEGQCLWVITPYDVDYPYWTEEEHLLVEISAAQSVITLSPASVPEQTIFGLPPQENWCYYFQKASLARQQADWTTVVALGDQVIQQQFPPDDVYEWLPFLEGYIRTQKWEQAILITDEILSNPDYWKALCNCWLRSLEGKRPIEVNEFLNSISCNQ